MLPAVNSKIKVQGIVYDWAEFKGISYLFDSPPESYRPDGLLCHGNSGSDFVPEFYRKILESFGAIEASELQLLYSLILLPPSSFHVTATDGLYCEIIDKVDEAHRQRFQDFIEGLPESLASAAEKIPEFLGSVLDRDWDLNLCFDDLAIWGDSVLVVKLKPCSKEDEVRLAEFKTARLDFFKNNSHLPLGIGDYTPHCSLGYFAAPTYAAAARSQIPYWSKIIREHMKDTALSLNTCSLHCFKDMSRFYKQLPV